MSGSVMAEEYVVNGDFSEGTTSGDAGQVLPADWTKAGNTWNNRTNVLEFDDAQSELDPNGVIGDLTNYVKESLYEWNSWETGTCSQVVELGTASSYTFSYISRAQITSVRKINGNTNPVSVWVRVYPCGSDGAIADGTEPIYDNTVAWEDGDEFINENWTATTTTIEPETDYVMLQIGVRGASGDDGQGGEGENQVSISASAFSISDGAGIEMIGAEALSTEYFSLDGVRVANPAKGSIVITKSIMSNGKVRVAKVVK